MNTAWRDEQDDGGEAGPAMPDRQAVEAEHALEPADAGHQEQLDEHGEGAVEAGELADRGQRPAGVVQRVETAVAQPQGEDHDGVGDDDDADVPGAVGARRPRRAPPAASGTGIDRAGPVGVDDAHGAAP